MTIDLVTLGARLRDARVNRGLTQEQAAEEPGLPRTAIVHIESGNRSIDTVELGAMAQLYQLALVDFFRDAPTVDDDVLVAVYRLAPELQNDAQVNREMRRCLEICKQ